MNDTQAMALVRHELLNTMYNRYPLAYSRPQLLSELRPALGDRDKTWLTDAINEQIKVLLQAGLVRPASGGYTLTDRGRRDRQQAQWLFNKQLNKDKEAA